MDHEDRIRERAHRIWEEEGRPEGRHREHWERACRELNPASVHNVPSAATPGITGRAAKASTDAQDPARNTTGSKQSTGGSGLVGAEDTGAGTPDAMGVDDLNVSGRLSDPEDSRPTTGRSKLVGS